MSGLVKENGAFDTLIHYFGSKKKCEIVIKVAEFAKEANLSLDTKASNIVCNALLSTGQENSALAMLNSMGDSEGAKPDVITFTSFITHYGHRGQIEAALGMLRRMQQSGISPNSITYSSLFTSCVKRGKVTTALQIWDDMRERNFPLELDVSLDSMILYLLREDKLYKSFLLLRKMKNVGVPWNNNTVDLFLDSCERTGKKQLALQVMKMRQQIQVNKLHAH